MSITTSKEKNEDGSFSDTGKYVACDECPEDSRKREHYPVLDLDTVVARAREAGWTVRLRYVPAGVTSNTTGKVVTKGHYGEHYCICPACMKKEQPFMLSHD